MGDLSKWEGGSPQDGRLGREGVLQENLHKLDRGPHRNGTAACSKSTLGRYIY